MNERWRARNQKLREIFILLSLVLVETKLTIMIKSFNTSSLLIVVLVQLNAWAGYFKFYQIVTSRVYFELWTKIQLEVRHGFYYSPVNLSFMYPECYESSRSSCNVWTQDKEMTWRTISMLMYLILLVIYKIRMRIMTTWLKHSVLNSLISKHLFEGVLNFGEPH